MKVIYKARGNSVDNISLPSHCTRRLQTFDVSVFKSVNADYNRDIHIWLRQLPGRSVTEFQIATHFGSAYTIASTVSNAVSGFRKCVFSDDDFVAADVTDKPDAAADLPHLLQSITSAGDLPDPQPSATSAGDMPNMVYSMY